MAYYVYNSGKMRWWLDNFMDCSKALKLPKHSQKVYKMRSGASFFLDDFNFRANFALVMNKYKDSTTFEVMYKLTVNNEVGRWEVVPPNIMERLFSKGQGVWNFCNLYQSGNWEKNTKVEVVDGHFLFKYDTEWLRYVVGSISQDNIYYMVPGRLVSENDELLCIALMYKNKDLSHFDLKQIQVALNEISSTSWSIRADGKDPRVERLRENLAKARESLEAFEKKHQQILEEAADAMNLLSSKYGIELDLET